MGLFDKFKNKKPKVEPAPDIKPSVNEDIMERKNYMVKYFILTIGENRQFLVGVDTRIVRDTNAKGQSVPGYSKFTPENTKNRASIRG